MAAARQRHLAGAGRSAAAGDGAKARRRGWGGGGARAPEEMAVGAPRRWAGLPLGLPSGLASVGFGFLTTVPQGKTVRNLAASVAQTSVSFPGQRQDRGVGGLGPELDSS